MTSVGKTRGQGIIRVVVVVVFVVVVVVVVVAVVVILDCVHNNSCSSHDHSLKSIVN